MSKPSRTSLRSYGKYSTRRKQDEPKNLLKPYNFCCDIKSRDDETRYDRRKPPFTSSLTIVSPIQESPTINFRFQSIEPVVNSKKKSTKNKQKSENRDLDGNPCVKTRGPLLWFQEDELEVAKNQFWSEKQRIYNEEADRNALIGEKKVKKIMASIMITSGPRWYQDLSIPQMKQVLALGETMTADYEETITTRTQKALDIIGATSTFFKVGPRVIKKLQRSTRLQPIEFLREIYKKFTGQYFEEEEYKKTYDCNERIILSAIAFLALPDAVIELNNRLPQISEPVFPPKPKPAETKIRHSLYKSPYKEPLFEPPDWVTYKKSLDQWHENCKLVPKPRIILPKLGRSLINDSREFKESEVQLGDKGIVTHSKMNNVDFENLKNVERSEFTTDQNKNNIGDSEAPFDLSIPTLPGGDKQTFDFTISGLCEKSGPVDYKICGTLKPPFSKRKSWLGDKEAQYIISGISEHEDPPKCPVTYVMTGISCVTPDNSDEKFLAELRLGDSTKRVYPAGRKNLSKNWQEWLQDADEEFLDVEREANKLIKSVQATMRLVVPGDRCDACCSCRQTRKRNLKEHATKTPYMVIDSIAEGDAQNKYIVGSLAMHSPAPSPAESTVNLLEVVASKETVQKKLVINGITNDSGETTYYISGVTEEIQHTPKMTVFKQRPPKPLRNVPPCACTIEKMFNEGKTPTASGDDIPQTKKKGICCGRKYRPMESPAFSCKEYPEDKSCRRNPFNNKLKRGIFPKTNCLCDDEDDGLPKEKKMFTLPAFIQCGDEEGMAICGGPWGAKNVKDPKVVAAKDAEAKQIPRMPKARQLGEEEDGEENEEEEEEEQEGGKKQKLSPRELAKIAKEIAAEEQKLRKKQLKRDNLCSERFDDEIIDAADANQSSTIKGIAAYCEFDNPWNRMRTAPTVNPWNNEYEKSLRLTKALLLSGDHNRAESPLKRKRKENGLNSPGENQNLNADRKKIKNNNEGNSKTAKDDVKVIYSSKQVPGDQPRLLTSDVSSRQQPVAKSTELAKEHVKQASPSFQNKLKDSVNKTDETHRKWELKNIEVKNRVKKFAVAKKVNNKVKSDHKYEKGNGRRNKPPIKNYCPNNKDEESSKKNSEFKRRQRHKPPLKFRNDMKHKKINAKARQAQVLPKTAEKCKEYKVAPAVIPDESRLPCQRENAQSDKEFDNCDCSDEVERSGDVRNGKEGPFGWRTKSQQELPREKTLVYLAEPNDPVEMIKVREGGRPCDCRENRNKKKILLYNIGGAVEATKGRRKSKPPQLIEGVTYLTPPPSPRNSSEYIPEYDLLESPYKMCERKRSDKDLKYINELSTFRSLSPGKNNNVTSCPCGYKREDNSRTNFSVKEPEKPKDTGDTKGNKLSSALKDEGLIDYFVSCQDAVPCWLRCAKFSKAGCCEKPKLLQVKKPVCECRYERRVVKREEEKQKWVNRQQRLKSAKKQPYLQVSGTSRPMMQDTKLIISSVKKVLQDGEFIPETQYCVTGIAENYAMGPPHYIVPGITHQSPVVTPEPSKPDILCMCGHRHWSPTDIATGHNVTESMTVRAKGEYPCRGREQQKEITEIMIPHNEKTISADNSEAYIAYHSCAGASNACHSDFDKNARLASGKKHKLISEGRNSAANANRNSKKLKLNTAKMFQEANEKEENKSAEAGAGKNLSEVREAIMTRTEDSKNLGKQQQFSAHEKPFSQNRTPEDKHPNRKDLAQNISNPENKSDLFGLMKIELEKMASEDFILAKLPECWLMPQLTSWIQYREGKVYTESMKNELCESSKKQWGLIENSKKVSIPLPSLHLTSAELATMTFDRATEMKKKIRIVQAKYYSKLRKMRVAEACSYWPTMEFGRFPSLSFKEAYFTYMAAKESDGHVFKPWKIGDTK